MADTVMVTVFAVLVAPSLSVTVRLNVRSSPAGVSGDMNVGIAGAAVSRVTAVPAVCVHAYDAIVPSLSVEPLPSRVTAAILTTLWAAPAFAVGAIFAGGGGVLFPLPLPPQPLRIRTAASVINFVLLYQSDSNIFLLPC